MSGRGSRVRAARLLCAAAAAAYVAPALAQTILQPPPAPQPPPDAAELNPNAPLDPLSDLGVAWPELRASDTTLPAPATTTAKGKTQAQRPSDGAGDIRYTVQVEGLAPVGNAEDLLREFHRQSALEAERKDRAN
ncbi:MAG: translocation and assembly module TamA, partial [Sphingomonadales bacterium]|nr:translocation and assembly module TamA [Sphingomonadales bacterium]